MLKPLWDEYILKPHYFCLFIYFPFYCNPEAWECIARGQDVRTSWVIGRTIIKSRERRTHTITREKGCWLQTVVGVAEKRRERNEQFNHNSPVFISISYSVSNCFISVNYRCDVSTLFSNDRSSPWTFTLSPLLTVWLMMNLSRQTFHTSSQGRRRGLEKVWTQDAPFLSLASFPWAEIDKGIWRREKHRRLLW